MFHRFFFWGRYLRFCPFVDCIGEYFFKSIFFFVIFLYRKFICVIFLSYVSFCRKLMRLSY
jgi:hypothetical protein